MICTFFGHKDTPQGIFSKIEAILVDLIENKQVDTFYVGNHGSFDGMIRKHLKKLKSVYPHINYTVVLAYMPEINIRLNHVDYSNTILPEGFENTPPKYAIAKRNQWMVERADLVVTYVKHSVGGAAKFKALSS